MSLLEYTQKKNVSTLLRLRLLRYRQTPNVLKRVNAHAERRELSTSVLVHCLENFADFRKTRIKSGSSSYVLMSVAMLPYAILF